MDRSCQNCRYFFDKDKCPRCEYRSNKRNQETYEGYNYQICEVYKVSRAKLAAASKFFDVNELTGRITFVPKLLADHIMKQHTFATHKESGEIYRYADGYYRPDGKIVIHAFCAKALRNEYRSNYAKEVIDYIKATTYSEFTEPPLNLVNVRNGIIDIASETKKLLPHNPKYKFLQQIPHDYNREKATSPEWDKFFSEVTTSQEDSDQLRYTIAYMLYRANPYHKATMCLGTGANGKSVFLSGVEHFLGKKNVSNRSLQELVYDRFATSDLHGKYANISGDLSNQTLRNTGLFKNIVAEDTITMQKKFLSSFKDQIYAKLLFACNQPPEPKYDESLAFFRRWNMITFPKVFMGNNCDPFKIQKLITEDEMSGLLFSSIDYLQALIANRGFPENGSVDDIKQRYMRKANPIQAFTEDDLTEDEEGFITTEQLHHLYTIYCKKNNFSAEGKNKFRSIFEKLGYLYTRQKNKRGFSGISIKAITTQTRLYTTIKDTLPDLPLNDTYSRGKSLNKNNMKEILGIKGSISGKSGMNQINNQSPNICFNCGESLPEDLSNCVFFQGKPIHAQCPAKNPSIEE